MLNPGEGKFEGPPDRKFTLLFTLEGVLNDLIVEAFLTGVLDEKIV